MSVYPPRREPALQMLAGQLALINEQILEMDRRIRASARATEIGRRLMDVPGVGPLLASALVATIPDPAGLPVGSQPRRLDRARAAAELQRRQGAAGGHHQARRPLPAPAAGRRGAGGRDATHNGHGTRRPWLVQLLARRTTKVAAVALANKMARMVWAIMTSGETYREPELQAA